MMVQNSGEGRQGETRASIRAGVLVKFSLSTPDVDPGRKSGISLARVPRSGRGVSAL